MKKSMVFFISVGCLFLSQCADLSSYSGGDSIYGELGRIDGAIFSIKGRLDEIESRLDEIDRPLGRLYRIEDRVKRLEESRNIQASYDLTVGEERLKKIEKSLEGLWAIEWERTKKEVGVK